jgi:hypothetical protein
MSIQIDFESDETPRYSCVIKDNIVLFIEKLNKRFLLLYFTDNSNNKINVPSEISVYECEFHNSKYKILLEKNIKNELYALFLETCYEIHYEDEIILNITS